ncbi:uncharacterized protein C5L36_0C01460 [Pichia kudriavzevii]|uniref:Uncharacterized protein n=1 Tax=Pichia kudriavzevii TaxID=4909 RepID=A0A2U9R554_PICKU|nr:uncharacterized protein C5L36_0C01460 [Pichia kudriavzevii]AWU76198.1 hypothetical protein C5L36_0C01460 [Pichia kudriavzevii]
MSQTGSTSSNKDSVEIQPIHPRLNVKEFTQKEKHRLLNRLFQELDDENTSIETLKNNLSELSLKSGLDIDQWSKRTLSVSVDKMTVSWNEEEHKEEDLDLLQDLQDSGKGSMAGIEGVETPEKERNGKENERELLLNLLHREMKLSSQYESLIDSYQNLLTYTKAHVKANREKIYGVDTDKPVDINQPKMQQLHSREIMHTVQNRVTSLRETSEFIKSATETKKIELELAKNNIKEEALKLSNILET